MNFPKLVLIEFETGMNVVLSEYCFCMLVLSLILSPMLIHVLLSISVPLTLYDEHNQELQCDLSKASKLYWNRVITGTIFWVCYNLHCCHVSFICIEKFILCPGYRDIVWFWYNRNIPHQSVINCVQDILNRLKQTNHYVCTCNHKPYLWRMQYVIMEAGVWLCILELTENPFCLLLFIPNFLLSFLFFI